MLFKFRKLTRLNQRPEEQQKQGDQISLVGRISRSLSRMRQRRSKSASSAKNNNINATIAAQTDATNRCETNSSSCPSIELVRQLAESRTSPFLVGQLAAIQQENQQQQQRETENQQLQHQTQSYLSMCDNNFSQFAEQEVPIAAAPRLATLSSDFDNCLDDDQYEQRVLAERRANYARRNIGAMRRHSKFTAKKQQETEWMFKLYDLPGSETEKQDMTEVAKSIRKTLISSLTPLIVETTSQFRQIAVPPGNQQVVDGSSGSNGSGATTPAALHLHITMRPEVVTPSQQSATSPQQDVDGAVSPSSNNNNNNVCVVRVSATFSSNEEPPMTSPSPAALVPEDNSSSPLSRTSTSDGNNNNKSYLKNLQQIDEKMIQSMPIELFDNRALMKRDKRLRRHRTQKLVDTGVQTSAVSDAASHAMISSVYPSNNDLDDDSPVFYQQQILLRHDQRRQQPQMGCKSVGQRSFVRPVNNLKADLRHARVVPLTQPQQHFYHYQQDDLFSETSVVGTYEERACSIAKCLNWMASLKEDEVVKPSSSPAVKKSSSNRHRRQPSQHQQVVVSNGAGEALAVPPCHVHHEYHHFHHHNHFVARI